MICLIKRDRNGAIGEFLIGLNLPHLRRIAHAYPLPGFFNALRVVDVCPSAGVHEIAEGVTMLVSSRRAKQPGKNPARIDLPYHEYLIVILARKWLLGAPIEDLRRPNKQTGKPISLERARSCVHKGIRILSQQLEDPDCEAAQIARAGLGRSRWFVDHRKSLES